MIAIIGESGCGKSTVEKELVNRGYVKALSDTTRKPRENEVDGVAYKFRSLEEMVKRRAEGVYAEYITFLDETYAIDKKYCVKNAVVVVAKEGLIQLLSRDDLDITAVYLYTTEEERRKRMLSRNDDPINVEERIVKDRENFKGVSEIVDAIILAEGITPKEIADVIEAVVLEESIIRGY